MLYRSFASVESVSLHGHLFFNPILYVSDDERLMDDKFSVTVTDNDCWHYLQKCPKMLHNSHSLFSRLGMRMC